MGTLLSYSGLSTKIRAMQSRLMTEKQYQEIAQMESVTQVVAYLKKQPGFAKLWADLDESSLHRGEIEKGRLSFRLTAPYSEERRKAASKRAKQNGIHSGKRTVMR